MTWKVAVLARARGILAASIAASALLGPGIAGATGDDLAPSPLSAPRITGDVAVGGSVAASTGSWAGSAPQSYAYQWEDCLTTCRVIAGATEATYVAGASDLGRRLKVLVTAANDAGSATAASPTTAPVAPSSSSLRTGLAKALVPHDPALTVAIELQTRGYELPFRALTPGRLAVNWYLGLHPKLAGPKAGLVRVASGSTRLRVARKSQVTIKPTPRGRRLVRRSRALSITAVATFTPDESDPVSATREFKLS
ncbi:MAG: hypothetical protein ACXVUE_09380 [Solirubrobacteraceae bacterium]